MVRHFYGRNFQRPHRKNSFLRGGHTAVKVQMLTIIPVCFEVCNVTKYDLQLLDFTINWFFMKLFRTNDTNVMTQCQLNFRFQIPSVLLAKRREKFVSVYGSM